MQFFALPEVPPEGLGTTVGLGAGVLDGVGAGDLETEGFGVGDGGIAPPLAAPGITGAPPAFGEVVGVGVGVGCLVEPGEGTPCHGYVGTPGTVGGADLWAGGDQCGGDADKRWDGNQLFPGWWLDVPP